MCQNNIFYDRAGFIFKHILLLLGRKVICISLPGGVLVNIYLNNDMFLADVLKKVNNISNHELAECIVTV